LSFDPLFHPRGIAIIGASADISRIGGHPIKALKAAGYKGGIFPINPKYQEMHGLTCYPHVSAIDKACDLAVVAVPAAGVPEAIRDCGKAGIRAAVVLTAGFREIGPAGRGLEAELKRAASDSGVRVIGPNCQGMLSVHDRVWAVFGSPTDETALRAGSVSCTFQSGGFGFAIVNLAEVQGLGFRYCVSTGNETDVTTPELLSVPGRPRHLARLRLPGRHARRPRIAGARSQIDAASQASADLEGRHQRGRRAGRRLTPRT
jgi:acyl-CoA synthetase (NDP forming)